MQKLKKIPRGIIRKIYVFVFLIVFSFLGIFLYQILEYSFILGLLPVLGILLGQFLGNINEKKLSLQDKLQEPNEKEILIEKFFIFFIFLIAILLIIFLKN